MPPGIGDPAPLFSGQDVLTGQPFSLADHQGTVVLVSFNGITWCPPCQFEAPLLESVWKEFQGLVQFVMVYVDDGKHGQALPSALQNFDITFPVITDPAGTIAGEYGVGPVPELFVLKADLTLCAKEIGASPPADAFAEMISSMLTDCGAPEPIPPIPVHEWLSVAHILFGVVQDGGGVVWPGGRIPPWSPLRRLTPEARTVLVALAIDQLARRVGDPRASQGLRRTALGAAQAAIATLNERVGLERPPEVSQMAVPK